MATCNIVNKNTAAYIDFQFGMINHADITQSIVFQSIKDAMISRLIRINVEFDEKGLEISNFTAKANKRRVHGWIRCSERERDQYLTAFQQIMTDRTVSKIISTKSSVKCTKIKIEQLMVKFTNDFEVETPSFHNTESIPDKYLESESFRCKSLKEYQLLNDGDSIISQLKVFGYSSKQVQNAMDNVIDNKDINSIIKYIDDTKESVSATDFSGIWELQTTDNLDLFMKSQGFGYITRKLMAAAYITLTIKHDLDANTQESKAKLPIGSIHDIWSIDGNTVFETTNPFGDKMKMIAHWKDINRKEIVVVNMENITANKKIVMERYMINKDVLHEKMVNENDVVMVRKFKRKN